MTLRIFDRVQTVDGPGTVVHFTERHADVVLDCERRPASEPFVARSYPLTQLAPLIDEKSGLPLHEHPGPGVNCSCIVCCPIKYMLR